MKPECEKCLMVDKSKEACIRRLCAKADLPPPKKIIVPKSKWHFEVGDRIGDHNIKIEITRMDIKREYFNAQVVKLEDKCKDHGHYGSYVSFGKFYQFKLISKDFGNLIWEIPEEGTDRFHREGSTGAQFLLYWSKNQGFTFDLDS